MKKTASQIAIQVLEKLAKRTGDNISVPPEIYVGAVGGGVGGLLGGFFGRALRDQQRLIGAAKTRAVLGNTAYGAAAGLGLGMMGGRIITELRKRDKQ